jgi:Ser/Thr protein kinase RdoA (MazF antagonist)
MSPEHDTFDSDELAVCLSHYDLGEVRRVVEFPRGSPRAPKVVIDSERGKFLLKRRPRGRDEPARVAYAHRLQLYLAGQNFPLPHLIGTRKHNNSMVVHEGAIYEMFELIEGGPYKQSPEATASAGRTMGLFHKLTQDYHLEGFPAGNSYHDSPSIRQAIGATMASLPDHPSPNDTIAGVAEGLGTDYAMAADAANEHGLANWHGQIVHGDWHPGNMLFRHGHVVAVLDYDSARILQRAIDLANGALQFSILAGGPAPGNWPSQLDLPRYKQFLRGYDSVNVISQAELQAMPFLMCEAMISEAVLPIAATGMFGRFKGLDFLQMIERKVAWVLQHADYLAGVLTG